jgi:D-sedoheptulose 7-phosphate isomerase
MLNSRIATELDAHIEVAAALKPLVADIGAAAQALSAALAAGGKLLFCGNGGSAADAQHLAAEFTGRFLKERDPLPAIALHCNTSSLTAIGNDYGFDQVFAREVRAHGRAGDVLIALSTSGNSENVLQAAHAAKRLEMKVIALTGQSGGKLAAMADLALRVPSASTPRIQEMHILIGHILCGLAEEAPC